jgi:hypothetical protein
MQKEKKVSTRRVRSSSRSHLILFQEDDDTVCMHACHSFCSFWPTCVAAVQTPHSSTTTRINNIPPWFNVVTYTSYLIPHILSAIIITYSSTYIYIYYALAQIFQKLTVWSVRLLHRATCLFYSLYRVLYQHTGACTRYGVSFVVLTVEFCIFFKNSIDGLRMNLPLRNFTEFILPNSLSRWFCNVCVVFASTGYLSRRKLPRARWKNL